MGGRGSQRIHSRIAGGPSKASGFQAVTGEGNSRGTHCPLVVGEVWSKDGRVVFRVALNELSWV